VIIVSYGTRDLTLAALESVHAAAARVSLETIVVDNDSPDDSADAIAEKAPWVNLIRSDTNRGFAAGANRGARAATGEWLLFLNSDARLRPDTIPVLLEAALRLSHPGALGPRIEGVTRQERSAGHFYGPWRDFVRAFHLYRLFPHARRFEGIFIEHLPDHPLEVDWVTGACLLVRTGDFRMLEGFDEAYFLYVEDMDLCFRLKKAGRTNLYVPQAVVDHGLGKSPKPGRVLLEGGDAPEYFVRKFRLGYPILLQRFLRCVGLLGWLLILSGRAARTRLAGRDASTTVAWMRLCFRSLAALLRPIRRTGSLPSSPVVGHSKGKR